MIFLHSVSPASPLRIQDQAILLLRDFLGFIDLAAHELRGRAVTLDAEPAGIIVAVLCVA